MTPKEAFEIGFWSGVITGGASMLMSCIITTYLTYGRKAAKKDPGE